MKVAVFQRLFDATSDNPDVKYATLEATIIKGCRYGQGVKEELKRPSSRTPGAGVRT
jgi:hypothetical protein